MLECLLYFLLVSLYVSFKSKMYFCNLLNRSGSIQTTFGVYWLLRWKGEGKGYETHKITVLATREQRQVVTRAQAPPRKPSHRKAILGRLTKHPYNYSHCIIQAIKPLQILKTVRSLFHLKWYKKGNPHFLF